MIAIQKDSPAAAPADTIPARLFQRAQQTPLAPAYHVKTGGTWKPTSWRRYAEEVRTVGKALMALGVEPGGSVALLGFNRPEWVILDLAAMAIGGRAAGVYTTCSAEEVQYIVDHAGASVILVENEEQWQKVRAERERLPKLQHIVSMKSAGKIADEVLSWDELLARAEDTADADFDDRVRALEPDGLATLIYTSGTTGPPKAVMLSHANLAWTADTLCQLTENQPGDSVLSYLPLSHIAEQMVTIHGTITAGGSVYFARSLEALPEDLREVQPTIFFAVPRVWEKFQAKIQDKLSQATGVKKHLVEWVRGVARRKVALENQSRPLPLALRLQHRLADKLVLSKLKPAVGLGRARVCVSGAAPISQEVIEFFASLDISIYEVYGQSEGTGPTTLNVPGRTRFGTVGPALPGVEVRIADDGEIQVRGPNVFLGYLDDPEATSETLVDGWLCSGDLGAFDEDGFLTITGRKKDILITAGGKNVAPKNIEAGLKDHPLINEAVVIGDRRKYLTALVTIDEEAIGAFLRERGEPADAPYHESAALRAEIQSQVDVVNAKLAQVETVKKFTILPRNLSVESGELTPTMKVKRKVVNESFADQIESMYA